MASLNLAPEELRAIEASRNRLFQLTNSLASLRNTVVTSAPLPSPESLQSSAFILQKNIDSIQQIMAENSQLFQRLAVHPSTNYPGRTQENILHQLLRKKLEPDVAAWYEDGRQTALAAGIDLKDLSGGRANGEDYYEEDEDDYKADEGNGGALSELWEDAREACQQRIATYIRNESSQPYTAAERALGIENVRTGLKRNLDEESDEEEEEDEDEDEDDIMSGMNSNDRAAAAGQATAGGDATRPAIEPEHILWFSARGDFNLPRFIDLQGQKSTK